MMKRPTIASLESNIRELTQNINLISKQNDELRSQREHYRLRVEDLERDKAWLKQMHSAVLQSMHEFTKGRH